MSNLLIPTCDDFIASFGCECNINEDYVQSVSFLDEDGSTLNLYIGNIDNSVKVVLMQGAGVVNNFYFENLVEFILNDEEQSINMTVLNDSYRISFEIKLWKKFEIKITGMLN
ncbi:hypothetical protein [Acinetobacter junii]|uniref:hypothetical protein n=1 Tax=Acinetobacter junii TaxID=40215 RepID=UPI00100DB2D5|nr:hypothetical protein [Acinetobacter junii]RXS93602.1 hypothetical protein ETZ13_12735 [Acinetobacter junii]